MGRNVNPAPHRQADTTMCYQCENQLSQHDRDVIELAYLRGGRGLSMPEHGPRDKVIEKYFRGVAERQEWLANQHGLGERLTTPEDVQDAFSELTGTNAGSTASFIAENLVALINQDTNLSAVLCPTDSFNVPDAISFYLEFSDMALIDHFRVDVRLTHEDSRTAGTDIPGLDV